MTADSEALRADEAGWDASLADIRSALGVARVLWPEFVLHDDQFVIIADAYTEDAVEAALREYGAENVEQTMNTFYLQYLFAPRPVDDHAWEQVGKILSQTWVARAEQLFPDRQFVASFQWYSDDSDPGIVIEQKKWRETRARAGAKC